jgi:diacylglycerol kinase family enzyme
LLTVWDGSKTAGSNFCRDVRVLLLVNSTASSVTPRGRVVIQKALSADHDVTLAETSRRGHATRLARGAAADGVEVVVALGGDGTLNEAANGLAGTDCALAPLPGGSTNVFARTLGLPNDPIEATGQRCSPRSRPGRSSRSGWAR